MNKEVSQAPQPKEAESKPEKLLSESTTGAQALLLLDLEPPKPDTPVLTVQKKQLFEHATEGLPSEHRKRLTTASFNERDEFWKDTPEAERMEKWRKNINAFLNGYTKDKAKTTEQVFLKTILKCDNPDEITADALYSTFMQGEGKGDIEFFARRIVDTHSDKIEEIERNQEFIKSLGKIYGDNSAKIGELLTYGIANARYNSEKFAASAQENLNKSAYGENVWVPLAENAAKWEEKQRPRPQGPTQVVPDTMQPPQTPQPEQTAGAKEYHPLVADARDATEKDLNKGVPNQDARFVDREHGAFGVFDGVGENIQGEVASSTASKYIEEALALIPSNLPLGETEDAVKLSIVGASKKLWEINEPRYRKLEEEYEKRRASQPLTEDDRGEVDSKSCMATTQQSSKSGKRQNRMEHQNPPARKKRLSPGQETVGCISFARASLSG